jgi:hypothetical protein
MGHELTKRHSILFEKKIQNPFAFARDVYQSGKVREFASFIVWELCHHLRLFPQEEYLKFNPGEALTLDNENVTSAEFSQKTAQFFSSRGLHLVNSAHSWKVLFISPDQEIFGCLHTDDRELYKSIDQGKSITLVKRFPERIKSIFISSQNAIFVCVKGAVYKSSDHGNSFKKTLDMGSSESFFRHNNAITETPSKALIIGEYGNIWENNRWRQLAYLYFSADNGETWVSSDFLIKKGINKHVHLVKYSRLFNKIFMADGDNYKKLWISEALTSSGLQYAVKWKPITKYHIQMGGYTSVIENDEKIIFGTDYQGGTNFFVESTDGQKFTKRIVPDPYRRSPIDNMVQRKSKHGSEIWANLPYSTANSKCLLMYSADGGESWNKVFEYRRATHKVWLVSSSSEAANELYFSIEDLKNNKRVVYKIVDG